MFALLFGLKSIAPRDLHAEITSGQAIAIDVNGRDSWLRARVPGAVNLDPAAFGERDLPASRDAALVFYCSNPLCRKAPSAARRAKSLGFTNVRVMSAGIGGWIDAGLPTESGSLESNPARK